MLKLTCSASYYKYMIIQQAKRDQNSFIIKFLFYYINFVLNARKYSIFIMLKHKLSLHMRRIISVNAKLCKKNLHFDSFLVCFCVTFLSLLRTSFLAIQRIHRLTFFLLSQDLMTQLKKIRGHNFTRKVFSRRSHRLRCSAKRTNCPADAR